MKTVLLLTHSAETQRHLDAALGRHATLVLLTPPAEIGRDAYDKLFATWMHLADGVFLDAVALGESTRWAIEALRAARTRTDLVIVARLTTTQQQVYRLPEGWVTLPEAESFDRVRDTLARCFELRDTQSRLKQLEEFRVRHPAPPRAPAPVAESSALTFRYREALKKLSAALGQARERTALLEEFARLMRELLGVSRLALLARTAGGTDLTIAASVGIRADVARQLRLPATSGLGAYLARDARVLRRAALAEPWAFDDAAVIQREFAALGVEVIVPMLDPDQQLFGALAFGERITGEPVAGDDLELVYDLLEQLARTVRHLELREQADTQQRYFQDALAGVQTGVVIVGADQRLLNVNPRGRELLGVGGDDPAGQPLSALPAAVADLVYEALRTGQRIAPREVTLPGATRVLGVNVSPVAARPGSVAVALIEDLTEEKRQQAAARAAQDQEFFTRVAYRLSHELKNSLVAIKIYGQLLPERYQEKEFREQFSTTVVNEVNRVDVLVNNLTFFSQPLALVPEELALTELLESCLANITREFARKQTAVLTVLGETPPEQGGTLPVITVKRNFAHRAPRVAADRIRLIQAVEHVVRNAVQSMPQNGRLLVSTADAVPADVPGGDLPAGGAVRITVQDTGEGIGLDLLARVTEPFVTTRNVGVGLGLTIVKKIIERHGGRLLIDSLQGQGTTVTLLVPVQAQPHPEDKLVLQSARGSFSAELFRNEDGDGETETPLAPALDPQRRSRPPAT